MSALLLVLAPWAEALTRRLPACPVRSVTHLPCPACGSGRALLALAHLEPLSALRWNPLAAVAAALFVATGLLAAAGAWLGRDLREPRSLAPVTRLLLAFALAANWAYLFWAGR